LKEEPELSWKSPFGKAAEETIGRLAGKMMENLPGTIAGEDIEALHDMRVASRRLRAALRVFRGCFPKNAHRAVVDDVRSITRALGTVRDQDVLIDYLRSFAESHPDAGIDWLIEREAAIRDSARIEMIESLRKTSESDPESRLAKLIESARCVGRKRRADSFGAQAPAQVKARLAEIKETSKAIPDPENVEGLHMMRISAKRLRYTMEAFTPCFGKPLEKMVAEVKLLQEQLGAIHDCDVWLTRLEGYRSEPGLSAERCESLDGLMAERRETRAKTYEEAVAHWGSLVESRFARRLMKLVSGEPGSEK